MTFTTDGKTIVFAVFGEDGCECKTLVGIFTTQTKADEFCAAHDLAEHADSRRRAHECGRSYQGKTVVEAVVLGGPIPCYGSATATPAIAPEAESRQEQTSGTEESK